ncbi:MAG: tetratricopeptide repeat protein [Myxococcales bacterium]|nr:tetratricopeptide repeat protein [Myxococcales bacterium]
MFRIPPFRSALVLLLMAAPVAGTALLPAQAWAQDRTQKSERRVLKATDTASRDAKQRELEEAAHDARKESIERLKQLLKDSPVEGDTKAEMLLRLADLYFEEGRFLYQGEMEVYQAEFDKCFNTPKCEPDKVPQEHGPSAGWQEKSIKLYRQILANYPQFVRADEATFYLGQALNEVANATGENKRRDESNVELTRLVKTYPDSRFIPDAYLLIGEYYFDKNEAMKALMAYQRAASFRDFEKYAFANYKLAWCWYNVGEYGKSIETMKTVVDYSTKMTNSGSTSRGNIQLQDEALKDLVRFFADAGDLDEAYEYFSKIGKPELVRDMLKRLASTYFEQGKFEQAIQTYRRLITEKPDAAQAPDYQNEIIQCLTKMGKKEDTIQEIDRLRTQYGKSSSWARANASNTEAVKSAGEFIEKNLRTVATNYQLEGNKLTGEGQKRVRGLAEGAYATYLDEFPDSKYSYDMRYAYGELLYKLKKFDIAYGQYMKVVAMDPKGQHSKFCAESAIFAADEFVRKESRASGGGPDPGANKDAIDLSAWEKKLLTALDQYTKLYPDDGTKVRSMIYKSAYLLYNKNQFKEASDRFRVVIGMDPKSREAEQAAELILDSFTLVSDWTNLKEVAKAFYDQAGLGSDAFKGEVFTVYENASLKLIDEGFKKTQDKSKGAADYWAFYQEFPKSTNADLALNNSSVYFRDLGRTRDSMKVRHELVEKFPKSKYYKDQVAALGFDYESVADFGNAASWYEKLFSLDTVHPGAKAAIFSAAIFRNSMGQWETAIGNYQKYMTTYKTEPNLNGVQLELAKTYEAHGKWADASKIYLGVYTLPSGKPAKNAPPPVVYTFDEMMFARLRYGLMMDKVGMAAKVTQHWRDGVLFYEAQKKAGATGEIATEAAAQMMFALAEPEYKAFLALKISGPGDKKLPQKQVDKIVREQLVGKVKAVPLLDATYLNIVKTGAGEWGVASLVRLGHASEDVGETLLKSYIPEYLTEDQKELYRMALEDKAYPARQKAADYYSRALAKAFELSIYNEATGEATRRLGVLAPDEYPGLFETIQSPRFAAPSATTASYEKEP